MATATKRISVTQSDIDIGVGGCCWTCPIAIAVKRAFDNDYRVWVTAEAIDLYVGSDLVHSPEIEHEVGEFALRFDLWASWMDVNEDSETEVAQFRENYDFSDDEWPGDFIETPEPFAFDYQLPHRSHEPI